MAPVDVERAAEFERLVAALNEADGGFRDCRKLAQVALDHVASWRRLPGEVYCVVDRYRSLDQSSRYDPPRDTLYASRALAELVCNGSNEGVRREEEGRHRQEVARYERRLAEHQTLVEAGLRSRNDWNRPTPPLLREFVPRFEVQAVHIVTRIFDTGLPAVVAAGE